MRGADAVVKGEGIPLEMVYPRRDPQTGLEYFPSEPEEVVAQGRHVTTTVAALREKLEADYGDEDTVLQFRIRIKRQFCTSTIESRRAASHA